MEYYDINFLISADLDKSSLDSATSWLDSKFNIAADSLEKKVKKIKLAYPIKKQTEAWHYELKFIAPADISPSFFEELRNDLKTKKEIIRSMIVKKKDEPPVKERRPRLAETTPVESEESSSEEKKPEIENKNESKKEAPVEIKKEKKVQLQEIDEKLEEILKEE